MLKNGISRIVLVLYGLDLVASQNDSQPEACVEWASSVPERLHTWVIGLLAVFTVVYMAAGNNQPLKQLKMPFLKHAMPTILISLSALLTVMASIGTALQELFDPYTKESRSCDALRVLWTVVPIVIGTAGAGSIFLTELAYRQYANPWPQMPRDDKRIKETGLDIGIPPGDSYGNGAVAVKKKTIVLVLMAIWLSGIFTGIFIALRGDVLNGLLSIAGIIAVWSNTGLPVWNLSLNPSGTDTATNNTVDFDCVEVNVYGDNNYQTAVLVQPRPRKFLDGLRKRDEEVVHYDGRIYALANAHAASTDFRGDAFQMATYIPYLNNFDELADVIVKKTNEVSQNLIRIFEATDVMNSAHRGAFTALTAAILDQEAWERYPTEHRERFRAASLAVAWSRRLCAKAGGSRIYFDEKQMSNAQCMDENCTNPLHRWLRNHDLKETVEDEARYLLGANAAVQPFKQEHKVAVDSLWNKVRERVGLSSHVSNTPVLICVYLAALQAYGAFSFRNADYFPSFEMTIHPFSVEDFRNPCPGVSPDNFKGKPLINAGVYRRKPRCDAKYNIKGTVTFENERQLSVPFHPKVIFHVAVRVLWRSIIAQIILWGIMIMKLLVG